MAALQTGRLLHPETLGEERVRRPLRVGMRNSFVALAALAVGGLGYLVRFSTLTELTAWWVWGAVAVRAVGGCFGHVYLGSRIGGRRANRIAVLVLFAALVELIRWMKQAMNAGR